MAISDLDRDAAEGQLRKDTEAIPRAVEARFDPIRSRIVVGLENGLELTFPPGLAEGLEKATERQLAEIEISPSGLGLHWPRIDADLYVPALLSGRFG